MKKTRNAKRTRPVQKKSKSKSRAVYFASALIVGIILATASVSPRAVGIMKRPSCSMIEDRPCYQTVYTFRSGRSITRVWRNTRHAEWFWQRFCENKRLAKISENEEETVICPESKEKVYDCQIGRSKRLHILKYAGECKAVEINPLKPPKGTLYNPGEISIEGNDSSSLETNCKPKAKEQLTAIESLAKALDEDKKADVYTDHGIDEVTHWYYTGELGDYYIDIHFYGYMDNGEEHQFQGKYTLRYKEGTKQIERHYEAYYWEDLPKGAFFKDYGYKLYSSYSDGEKNESCECKDYTLGDTPARVGCEGICCH